MHGRRRTRFPLTLVGAACCLLLAALATSGCSSPAARRAKARIAALQSPLGSLADQGDLDAMRLVADIEVLRSQSVFSDSVANALTALPGTAFLGLDEKGAASRVERGADITTLLAFTGDEPSLLQDGVITADEAAEVRRLAVDNMAAAAEKAKALRARRSSGLP